MKIIFAAGGSGGHIFPALSTAEELSKFFSRETIVFLGRPHSLEEKIVTTGGYRFEVVPSAPLPESLSLQTPRFVVKSMSGVACSYFLLRKLRSRVVVGFGGYVSAPVVGSAALLKIPVLLHEQNLVPGRANRCLFRFARRIALSFPETEKYLKKPFSAVVTGNPIRSEILRFTREEGLKRFKLRPDRFTILIMGGSRGARLLNTIVPEVFSGIEKERRRQFQLIHLTGEEQRDAVSSVYRRLKIESRVFSFLEEIAPAYAGCDLLLSRGGATVIAEITARGVPAILIPYRYAGGHQKENSRWLEKAGACLVLEEEELSAAKLRDVILGMASDTPALQRMMQASQSMGRPEAASNLAQEIIKLLNPGEVGSLSRAHGPQKRL